MKQRAVLLTHAVRIAEKRLEEEKLQASEQARLDEAFNTTEEIIAMSKEVEAAIMPFNGDKSKVLEVLNGFTTSKLKAFIHAHTLATLNRRGAEFNSLPKLNAAAAAACLILAAYECMHKTVKLLPHPRWCPRRHRRRRCTSWSPRLRVLWSPSSRRVYPRRGS